MPLSSQSSRNDALAKLLMDIIYLMLMQTAMVWMRTLCGLQKMPFAHTKHDVLSGIRLAYCFSLFLMARHFRKFNAGIVSFCCVYVCCAAATTIRLRIMLLMAGIPFSSKALLHIVCWAPWSNISHQMSSTRVSLQSHRNSQHAHAQNHCLLGKFEGKSFRRKGIMSKSYACSGQRQRAKGKSLKKIIQNVVVWFAVVHCVLNSNNISKKL